MNKLKFGMNYFLNFKNLKYVLSLRNIYFLFFRQKNASDPQRFHRRGYSALAEDKTRKKFESNLRECELRLQNLADEFQQKNHGQAFIMSTNGKEIADYIVQRKDDYTKAKEREREAAKVNI